MPKIMSLDVEYNQPSGKTIEIAAAIFDTKSGECLDVFESFVNPGEKLSKEIIDLTGITNSDLSSAPGIIEVFESLKNFHKKSKCFKNPLVWGSGERNDSIAIYSEYVDAIREKNDWDVKFDEVNCDDNFMGFRVIDVKTLYQSVQLYRNSKYGGSLIDSMTKFKMDFEGKEHRALSDAKNTFRFWFFLTKALNAGLTSI